MWLEKDERERINARSLEERMKRRTSFTVTVQDFKDVIKSSKAAVDKMRSGKE